MYFESCVVKIIKPQISNGGSAVFLCHNIRPVVRHNIYGYGDNIRGFRDNLSPKFSIISQRGAYGDKICGFRDNLSREFSIISQRGACGDNIRGFRDNLSREFTIISQRRACGDNMRQLAQFQTGGRCLRSASDQFVCLASLRVGAWLYVGDAFVSGAGFLTSKAKTVKYTDIYHLRCLAFSLFYVTIISVGRRLDYEGNSLHWKFLPY